MDNRPNEDTRRSLLRVRLPDGTEAVFRKAADSRVTLVEALSSLGGRFQDLAERIRSGSADNVASAEFDAELDAQIGELNRLNPPEPPPAIHELAQRVEDLERRVAELEKDRPRQ